MHPIITDLEKLRTKNLKNLLPGQTIRIKHNFTEDGKKKSQTFEGIIIKTKRKKGLSRTVTVRKIVEGVGVEKIFPVSSPIIEKIEIKKHSKVRRAKLYYIRSLTGKSARLKRKNVKTKKEIEKTSTAEVKSIKDAKEETKE